MSVVMVVKVLAVPLREYLHPVIGHGSLLQVIVVVGVHITDFGVPA